MRPASPAAGLIHAATVQPPSAGFFAEFVSVAGWLPGKPGDLLGGQRASDDCGPVIVAAEAAAAVGVRCRRATEAWLTGSASERLPSTKIQLRFQNASHHWPVLSFALRAPGIFVDGVGLFLQRGEPLLGRIGDLRQHMDVQRNSGAGLTVLSSVSETETKLSPRRMPPIVRLRIGSCSVFANGLVLLELQARQPRRFHVAVIPADLLRRWRGRMVSG